MNVYPDANDAKKTVVEIKAFTDLNITTMTCGCEFEKISVNLDTAYHLLPITYVKPLDTKKKKNKIPFLDKPGAVVTMRYKDELRGLRRSDKVKSFSHSIIIDICTRVKSLSTKLAPQSIHICGATSKQVAIDGVKHIIEALLESQYMLEYIKDNPQIANAVGDYIKRITRGFPKTKSVFEQLGGSTTSSTASVVVPKIMLEHKSSDHGLLVPALDEKRFDSEFDAFFKTYLEESKTKVVLTLGTGHNNIVLDLSASTVVSPPVVDVKRVKVTPYLLAKYFLSHIEEHQYHTDYRKKITWILRLPSFFIGQPVEKMCCAHDIKIVSFDEFMMNYNYDLSFPINRYVLFQKVNKVDGFFAVYDNSVHHQVTVELPVVFDPNKTDVRKRRKKNDVPCWVWLIHRSGRVTMSSPTSNGAEEAYYKLMKLLANSIPDIVGMDPIKKRASKKSA